MFKKLGIDSVYFFVRFDGYLFNILWFWVKNKIRLVIIRDLLFVDDVVLVFY